MEVWRGWPFKNWMCTFTIYWPRGKNTDALSCDPVAVLFPSASVPDAGNWLCNWLLIRQKCNPQRVAMKAWTRDGRKSWAFSSHPVLGRGCLTRRWKRAHDIVLNSFQIQRSSATFCTLCLGCMSLPSHSGNYSNILYHMERKRLRGSFYGPEETVWRSSQWNYQWSP